MARRSGARFSSSGRYLGRSTSSNSNGSGSSSSGSSSSSSSSSSSGSSSSSSNSLASRLTAVGKALQAKGYSGDSLRKGLEAAKKSITSSGAGTNTTSPTSNGLKTMSDTQSKNVKTSYQNMINRGMTPAEAKAKLTASIGGLGYDVSGIGETVTANKVEADPTKTTVLKVDPVGDIAEADLTVKKETDDTTKKDGGVNDTTTTTTEDTPTQMGDQEEVKSDVAGDFDIYGKDAVGKDAEQAVRNAKIADSLKTQGKVSDAEISNYLNQQPGFAEAPEADKQNTINKIKSLVTGEDAIGPSTADRESIRNMEDYAIAMKDRDLNVVTKFDDKMEGYLDEMRIANEEAGNQIDAALQSRKNAMADNYTKIFDSINRLEEQANNLFDKEKMIARQQRAKQLADAGILTSEQAASAAQYSMQDYVMNVELQRAELMKQMQEEMTNALKEKTQQEDQILSQGGLDAVTKQNMIQNLNGMYQSWNTQSTNYLNAANAKFDNLMAGAKQAMIDFESGTKAYDYEAKNAPKTTVSGTSSSASEEEKKTAEFIGPSSGGSDTTPGYGAGSVTGFNY